MNDISRVSRTSTATMREESVHMLSMKSEEGCDGIHVVYKSHAHFNSKYLELRSTVRSFPPSTPTTLSRAHLPDAHWVCRDCVPVAQSDVSSTTSGVGSILCRTRAAAASVGPSVTATPQIPVRVNWERSTFRK